MNIESVVLDTTTKPREMLVVLICDINQCVGAVLEHQGHHTVHVYSTCTPWRSSKLSMNTILNYFAIQTCRHSEIFTISL